MKIVTFVRQTEDWANATLNNITFPPESKPRQIEIKQLWRGAFATSFCQYRHQLKQIASRMWPGEILDNLQNLKGDELVLPTDDDDWFHPEIESFLHTMMEGLDFICWNTLTNQTVHHFTLHSWADCHKTPCSNSYCVRASFLKQIDIHEANRIIHSHSHSLTAAERNGASVADLRSTHTMSLYNWHPGSASAFMNVDSVEQMWRLIPQNNPPPAAPQWSWCEPYRSQVVEMVKAIQIRTTTIDPKIFL